MGNCCDRACWELKKMFFLYSTDYEVLEYDTVQRTISYQSTYDSVERNMRFDSIIPQKIGEQAPFDIIGRILEFVTDSEVFMKVVHCSKSFKHYIETQYYLCGRNVVFNFRSSHPLNRRSSSLPLSYVHHMKILCGSDFRDGNFQLFPNLESLIIWKGIGIRGNGLKYLKNLRSLKLWQCDLPGHYVTEFFSQQLHTFEISNSLKVTEKDISQFTKLRNLSIKKCYHLSNWSEICQKSEFYNSTLRRLDITECKVTSEFVLPKCLKTLKVASCRSFSDREIDGVFENLECLSISNCQRIRGCSFHKFERLRKLSLQWLDQLIKSPTIFQIPTLEELKIQGCLNVSNDSIKDLDGITKLTLIEEQQITDDAFFNLKNIKELSLVQCNGITSEIIQLLKGNLKILKVVGCDKINSNVLEDLELSGIKVIK